MTKNFSNAFSAVLCLAALLLCAAGPVAATAAEAEDTPSVPTQPDGSTTEAPVTGLTPEQIEALQSGSTDLSDLSATDTDDKNIFEKVSDFITDHAPFFIIGIVVIAAIICGIFIMRGRSKSAKAMAPGGRGASADVPSASEIRRRKRAAMQRSREEERLRRKAGMDSRQMAATTSLPLSAGPPGDHGQVPDPSTVPLDPVEAEKQSARATAAGAVARSVGMGQPPAPTGAIPAPVSPSQTAPHPGIVTPGAEPDTMYAPVTGAEEIDPEAAAAFAVPRDESPTRVNPLSDDLPEPPLEAPGLDSRVGEAAAAFAGGAVGGEMASRAADRSAEPEAAEPGPAETGDELAVDPEGDAARDAESRLRAKVAEIRAEQGRPVTAPAVPLAPTPEPVPEASVEEDLDQADSVRREIETSEPPPEAPSGLAGVEERLQASGDLRDQTLRNAEARLKQIEERAADAERRAAFAERLAQLKIDESERERRLNEIMTGIDRAEGRAVEAEKRAKAAESVAAAALEDDEVIPASTDSIVAPPQGLRSSEPGEAPPAAAEVQPESAPEPPASPGPAPQADEPAFASPAAKSPLFGSGLPGSTGSSGSLNLNSATFEELREADLSVTQATRILAYRERFGGYHSVEDLEKVPGFPAELIESLSGRITV